MLVYGLWKIMRVVCVGDERENLTLKTYFENMQKLKSGVNRRIEKQT